VVKVKGTQVTARRGQFERTRNIEKFKILMKRPVELQVKKKTDKHRVAMDNDEEEDDWMDGYNFHRVEVHVPVGQEEQVEEQDAQHDDGNDDEDDDGAELGIPAQLQEEVAAQLRNPAVSISGRLRKAPDRYGIDPVENERAGHDDNEELVLNSSCLTPRTLTPAGSPGKLAEAEALVPDAAQVGSAIDCQASPVADVALNQVGSAIDCQASPVADVALNQVGSAIDCQASPVADVALNQAQDFRWLPVAEVEPGRTARQRAQDMLEKHRHWSTAAGGIPDHPRFEGWNPNQQTSDEPDMGTD